MCACTLLGDARLRCDLVDFRTGSRFIRRNVCQKPHVQRGVRSKSVKLYVRDEIRRRPERTVFYGRFLFSVFRPDRSRSVHAQKNHKTLLLYTPDLFSARIMEYTESQAVSLAVPVL